MRSSTTTTKMSMWLFLILVQLSLVAHSNGDTDFPAGCIWDEAAIALTVPQDHDCLITHVSHIESLQVFGTLILAENISTIHVNTLVFEGKITSQSAGNLNISFVEITQSRGKTEYTENILNIRQALSGWFNLSMADTVEINLAPSSTIGAELVTASGTSKVYMRDNSTLTARNGIFLYDVAIIYIEQQAIIHSNTFYLGLGASVNGIGTGHKQCQGAGAPTPSHWGASHGGLGGNDDFDTLIVDETIGSAYGDAFFPTDPGSGSCHPAHHVAARGGSSLQLDITDWSYVEGTIDMSGGDARPEHETGYIAGGGSGGSVLLKTKTLIAGSGTIRSDGGNGGRNTRSISGSGAGGAGGRIAVYVDHRNESGIGNAFGLNLEAFGGLHGKSSESNHIRSAPGTIFWQCGTEGSQLVVDGGVGVTGVDVGPTSLFLYEDNQIGNVSVLRNGELLGDGSGYLRCSSGILCVLSSSEYTDTSDKNFRVQRHSGGKLSVWSYFTVYTYSVSLTNVGISISEGAEGHFPDNVFICGVSIHNAGKLFGIRNMSFCSQDPNGKILGKSSIYGCTDLLSSNYNSLATLDDGSCEDKASGGCTYSFASNFDPSADYNDGSCSVSADLHEGCICKGALNFDQSGDIGDGSCVWPRQGCTYSVALNFDPSAQVDDGSCIFNVAPVTPPSATQLTNGSASHSVTSTLSVSFSPSPSKSVKPSLTTSQTSSQPASSTENITSGTTPSVTPSLERYQVQSASSTGNITSGGTPSVTPSLEIYQVQSASSTGNITIGVTPSVTPSLEIYQVQSRCGDVHKLNCGTMTFSRSDSVVFSQVIAESRNPVGTATNVTIQLVNKTWPSVNVACSSQFSSIKDEIAVYSGCQDRFSGTTLDIELPIVLDVQRTRRDACSPGTISSNALTCTEFQILVSMIVHDNATNLLKQQIPLIKGEPSSTVSVPLRLSVSAHGEVVVAADKSLAFDIHELVEFNEVKVSVNPDKIVIDTSRSTKVTNSSCNISRFVVLTLGSNHKYTWSPAADLLDVVQVPPPKRIDKGGGSLKEAIRFNTDRAVSGLTKSEIRVRVTDEKTGTTETLAVAVSIFVREAYVELPQTNIEIKRSSSDPSVSREILLINSGHFKLNWYARLFTDGGEELTRDDSFWVKPQTGDFPIGGQLNASGIRSPVFNVLLSPANVGRSGEFQAWMLFETDSMGGTVKEFEDNDQPTATSVRYEGFHLWLRLKLLITSVFVCPERPIKIQFSPFDEVEVTWKVVNVARQPVLVHPMDFRLQLVATNVSTTVSGDTTDTLSMRYSEGALRLGSWITLSPVSAVVAPGNTRSFRANFRYNSPLLRGSLTKVYMHRANLMYSLSILTVDQWMTSRNSSTSSDLRKLRVETVFLPGSADPAYCRLATNETRVPVGTHVDVDVILADVFGNTAAEAVFISSTVKEDSVGLVANLSSLSVELLPRRGYLGSSSVSVILPVGLRPGRSTQGFPVRVILHRLGKVLIGVQVKGKPIFNSPITISTMKTTCKDNEVVSKDGTTCECRPGRFRKYSQTGDKLGCVICQEGLFQPTPTNDRNCKPCPRGLFSIPGSEYCWRCPSRGFDCAEGILRMKSGYWCELCVERNIDKSVDDTVRSQIVDRVQQGQSIVMHRCDPASACQVNATSFTTMCSEGRRGPLCDVCHDGYARAAKRCLPCKNQEQNEVTVFFSVFLALSLVVGLNLAHSKKDVGGETSTQRSGNYHRGEEYGDLIEHATSNEGAMALLKRVKLYLFFVLDYMQILALLGGLEASPFTGSIRWFKAMAELSLLSPTHADAFRCVVRLSFFESALLSLIAPWALIIGSLALQIVVNAVKSDKSNWKTSMKKALEPLNLLLGLIHTAVVMTVVNIFDIYPEEIYGNKRLRASLEFTTSSEQYTTLAVLGSIALFSVIFGVPAFMIAYMIWSKKNAKSPALIDRFLSSIRGFRVRNKGYLWPALTIIRRTLIVLIVFLLESPIEQSISVSIVLLFSGWMSTLMKPYKLDTSLNWLESLKCLCCGVTATIGVLQLFLETPTKRQRVEGCTLLIQLLMLMCIGGAFVFAVMKAYTAVTDIHKLVPLRAKLGNVCDLCRSKRSLTEKNSDIARGSVDSISVLRSNPMSVADVRPQRNPLNSANQLEQQKKVLSSSRYLNNHAPPRPRLASLCNNFIPVANENIQRNPLGSTYQLDKHKKVLSSPVRPSRLRKARLRK